MLNPTTDISLEQIPAELFELKAALEQDWPQRTARIAGPIAEELSDQLQTLKGQIEAKEGEVKSAEEAVAEHRKALEGAPIEDLQNPQSDLMKKADDIVKPLSTAKSELAELNHAFKTLALMQPDGGKSLRDDPEVREARTKAKDAFHSESLGMKAVGSEMYKQLKAAGAFEEGTNLGVGGQVALTDAEDPSDHVKALRARAALSKALITGQNTSGASLLTPEQLPGIDIAPQLPLGILALVSIGQTSSRSVRYRRLLSRTIRAAAVREAETAADIGSNDGAPVTALRAGLKPESDLLFEAATAEVSTFAHLIPMTRDELDDAEGLASTVDSEMRTGVERETERQIVRGTGLNEELLGIINTPGIASYVQGTAVVGEPRVDAIHRVFTMLRIAGYEPSALAIHPNDWQEVRLQKDANENYVYGPPSQAGAQQVWGVPIRETIAVDEDNPIAGEWGRAEYRVRSGVQTFLSDSHKDWFARNLLALLAEARGMLLIRRPQAFGEVQFV